MAKYLIIRFSSIGDIVLTTPVVRCIHEQIPGAEIHFLTKKIYVPLIAHLPGIKRVISIEHNISEVMQILREENYDHIIDLHKNIRSKSVIMKLHRPSTSFNKLNIRKWLLVNLKINLLPPVHIAERYMQAAAFTGAKYDGKGLDFAFPEPMNPGPPLPAGFINGYLCIVTGAKQFTKRIPPGLILEIIKGLNYPVVLMGGAEDRNTSQVITEAAGGNVYNACGLYDISGSSLIIRNAKLVITADTGLMHISAALRKPVISVWGNTVPGFGMYPLMPAGMEHLSFIAENLLLSCRPCTKLGYRNCPRGHFKCMMGIDPRIICQQARKWIDA